LLPTNSGRYRVGPEGAERTADEADVVLPVDSLAMIYLGGTRPSSLAAVGRLQVGTPEALRRVDQLFAIDVPPWCGTMF
jgi:predicted acetyltransferase